MDRYRILHPKICRQNYRNWSRLLLRLPHLLSLKMHLLSR
jgi:hypothetical protein